MFVHFRNGYTHWIDSSTSVEKKIEEDQFSLNKLKKWYLATLFFSSFSSINNETAKKKKFFFDTKKTGKHTSRTLCVRCQNVMELLDYRSKFIIPHQPDITWNIEDFIFWYFMSFSRNAFFFFFFTFRLVSETSKKNHFINLVWRCFF